MSDFARELEGKAYLLVSGVIDLDEFKSWYQLAQAAKAEPAAVAAVEPAAPPSVLIEAKTAHRRPKEFEDFIPIPDDADQEDHHRNLLGSGPMKPVL